jgi:AraC-like DNA-binding protein
MLRAQARAEAALVHAAALLQRNQLDWREVALLAGYTDQPHLCRETRRLTGFSPVQLMRGMLGDEAFWVYRAWAMARLGGSGPGWAG